MKTNWIYWAVILFAVEKIVQHIFVTLAFFFNWSDIASTVAVAPTFLMISGAFVALLFLLSLWGLLKKKMWALNLLIFLALFDMAGEFVAQGRIAIMLNVSFLVALCLLILTLVYRRSA